MSCNQCECDSCKEIHDPDPPKEWENLGLAVAMYLRNKRNWSFNDSSIQDITRAIFIYKEEIPK